MQELVCSLHLVEDTRKTEKTVLSLMSTLAAEEAEKCSTQAYDSTNSRGGWYNQFLVRPPDVQLEKEDSVTSKRQN